MEAESIINDSPLDDEDDTRIRFTGLNVGALLNVVDINLNALFNTRKSAKEILEFIVGKETVNQTRIILKALGDYGGFPPSGKSMKRSNNLCRVCGPRE